jgi:hypothetical protein
MERMSSEELQQRLLEELPAVQARLQATMANPHIREGRRRRAARLERRVSKVLNERMKTSQTEPK